MDTSTWRWWTTLRVASVLNLALWVATAILAPMTGPYAHAHLWLALVYTLVCGFRSFRPRVDLERTVLVDDHLSAIALGRTSATIAEMAFTVQCSLFVVMLGTDTGLSWTTPAGWALVPLIAVAQTCCWLGVLTLNHLWHAAEELLWGVMMLVLAVVFVAAWPGAGHVGPAILGLGLFGCASGAFVMLVLDVPMYLRRHRVEVAAGTQWLSPAEGFSDAVRRREPTGDWAVWKREVAWMTPYFTAGVWLSIALVWL